MVARRYHLLTRMSSCKSPRVRVDEAVKQFSLPRGNLTLFEILKETPMTGQNVGWEGHSNKQYLTGKEVWSRGQMRQQG